MRKLMTAGLIFGLILITTLANAQRPQPAGGRGAVDAAFLLKNKSVQEEIKLTDEQKDKLQPQLTELEAKRMEIFKEIFAGGAKGKPDKESTDKMQAKMKELNDPFNKLVEETLKSDQKIRLKQIQQQQTGINGLINDEELGKTLKITEEQKTKIKAISDENQKEFRELMKDKTDGLKKIQELRKEGMEKALAVLDKDQKAKWDEMTGKPFEIKMEFPGGFSKKDKK